ncbi:MAG: 4a-hydroxytetrahydrobiopterin dehydratase [Chloroflexi bacterium]|nr:4a-hydroxytetrahydrobiopterin dehydratase [Chloroflexota bacterium]MDA1147280.1 4a-hydroxytetrahydrobiopterin dehydratase [Chloroflexota bacterium]
MADRLDDTAVIDALAELPGWSRHGDSIVREFEFADFIDAVGFMAKVGALAERANHHPELSNVYNRVRIALSTHDAGGITERDLSLAREITERV